jgi:hypothetical protein
MQNNKLYSILKLTITFNAETLTFTIKNKRRIQKINTTFGEKLWRGKKG